MLEEHSSVSVGRRGVKTLEPRLHLDHFKGVMGRRNIGRRRGLVFQEQPARVKKSFGCFSRELMWWPLVSKPLYGSGPHSEQSTRIVTAAPPLCASKAFCLCNCSNATDAQPPPPSDDDDACFLSRVPRVCFALHLAAPTWRQVRSNFDLHPHGARLSLKTKLESAEFDSCSAF